MVKKNYIKLEFDKILYELSKETHLAPTKKMVEELSPMEDKNLLINKLNEVNDAVSMILKYGNPPIYEVKPINEAKMRLEAGGSLNAKELLNIAKLLRTVEELKNYGEKDEVLPLYFDNFIPLRGLLSDIEKKIISEGEVADNASIKLYSIRKKIKTTHSKIRDILNKFITSPQYQKYLQENIITVRQDRFVLPVKIEHKGDIPGIVHDTSSSGGTVFVEPMAAVEANNSLKEMFNEEEKEIEKILYDLSNVCALHTEEIYNNYTLLCEVDFIFAKAKYALKIDGVMPKINSRGFVSLKKARHPLIDKKTVVPINLELGAKYGTLIVTGPNTGGKTVSLKTMGLLTLMGTSGLFISAQDGSEVSIFDEIFADIGDEQSIAQSLSTFSSHMVNIVDIIKKATSQSLVLFDELGAGTDPVEGASLAIGIIEELRKKGTKIMATTHYSELKLYALSEKGVENAGCEFDVETLKPTYRILTGIPGKSNAFAISKKLGLPDYVLETSRKHLNEDNIRFEDVLGEIEKQQLLLRKERELTEKFKNEAESLREELARKKEKNEEKYTEIINKANIRAKEILEEAKEDADRLIKELRSIRKNESQRDFDRKTIAANKGISDKIKKRKEAVISTKNNLKPVDPKKLLKGTAVRIIEHDQPATVTELPDKDGNLVVTAGILKIRTNIKNLCLDTEVQKETTYQTQKKIEFSKKNMSNEINLIGKTVADGVSDAEKFIDDAIMLHLDKVSIIHGKGTGVLRAAIHAMLKKHSQVKSFRLGTFGEGETGVTIVELKK